jgi:hypothetical protein
VLLQFAYPLRMCGNAPAVDKVRGLMWTPVCCLFLWGTQDGSTNPSMAVHPSLNRKRFVGALLCALGGAAGAT